MKKILLSSYLLTIISLIIILVSMFCCYSTFTIWIALICTNLLLIGAVIAPKISKKSKHIFWYSILLYIIGITNIIWCGFVLYYSKQDMIISTEWKQWFFGVVLIKIVQVAVVVIIIYLLLKIFKRRNKS